jgi:cytochrome c oxidase cbb3-type subunit 1
VSHWYLIAGLLAFPWLHGSAHLVLLDQPVRGVMQAVSHWWYAHAFLTLWLTPMALAVGFHLIPSLTGRPLHSYYLALAGFWMLLVIGGFGGVPADAPVPAWSPAVSTVGEVLLSMPVLATLLNWHKTLEGAYEKARENPALQFVVMGGGCYLLLTLLMILSSFRSVNLVLQFSHFTTAVAWLGLFGFVGLILFGAIHHALPRILDVEWPSARMTRAHFLGTVAGLGLFVAALALGGVVQGRSNMLFRPSPPLLTTSRIRVRLRGGTRAMRSTSDGRR